MKKRVFVFGLDGATFDLILPWVEQGDLPNFAALLRDGAWAPLESVPSMRSPAAWSTMLTGKNPGKHGLYEFYEPIPNSYDVRFVNGGMRHGKSLWRLLGEAGKQVAVINVPMTYPAEEVNGFLIAGLDAPGPDSPGFNYPSEILSELKQKFGPYILEPGLTGCIVGGRPDLGVEKLREEYVQKDAITKYLMETKPWDFFMVVFRSLDAVQHCYWKYMDPEHPHYDAAEARKYGNVIRDAYRQLDGILGNVRGRLDDNTVLMLMSDHGFGRKHPANSQLNHWLASQGFLQFKSAAAGKKPLATRMAAAAYRLVAARAPRSVKEKLANWLPKLRNRVQSRLIYSNIEWSGTKAFADSLFAAVRINVRGREPLGTVAPGREYNEVVDKIRRALLECRDSVTGNLIVQQVDHRDEIYSGDQIDQAPDLLIRWKEDEVIHGIALPDGFAPTEDQLRPPIPGEDPRIISGDHKMYGVFALCGPGIEPGKKLTHAHLQDLSPTILAMFDLPIPEDFDGGVLQEAFTHPLAVQAVGAAASQPAAQLVSPSTDYSTEEEEAVKQRLRDLGYLE